MQDGGVGIISYRPTQVDPALLKLLDQWMLTRTRLPTELTLLDQYLPGGSAKSELLQILPTFPQGQAYLFNTNVEHFALAESTVTFRAGPRAVPHVRHLYKYLQAPLPTAKRFYFCDTAGRFIGITAASLAEFNDVLNDLPLLSLDYHLHRGDFERWVRNVLRDEDLAHRLRKIARWKLQGEEVRAEVVIAVGERYDILGSLT